MASSKLSKKHVDSLRKVLLKIKETILHDIKSIESSKEERGAEEVPTHAMHMADVATDMYDREFNLNIASNDRELLQKVEAALKRIEQGHYGLCEECGQSIPLARLKALPYATTCVRCQEEIEKQTGR